MEYRERHPGKKEFGCFLVRYSSCRYNERQLIHVTVVRRVRPRAERWCDCEGHRRWKRAGRTLFNEGDSSLPRSFTLIPLFAAASSPECILEMPTFGNRLAGVLRFSTLDSSGLASSDRRTDFLNFPCTRCTSKLNQNTRMTTVCTKMMFSSSHVPGTTLSYK